VDAAGKLAVPVVSYTTEPGEEFHKEFFGIVGNADDLQSSTATVPMSALLNVAQGIYFVKKMFPDAFTRSVRSYNPQYFGYLSDRRKARSLPIGLPYLPRNFREPMVRRRGQAGLNALFSRERRSPGRSRLSETGTGRVDRFTGTTVYLGNSQSNSALLPYLLKHEKTLSSIPPHLCVPCIRRRGCFETMNRKMVFSTGPCRPEDAIFMPASSS
jgi:hypothetical protein